MKKTAFLLIFSILTALLFAGKIENAFKALEEYNYFEAKRLFEKSWAKKKVAASFGLAVIFERSDNPFHHLDSAYKYICLADSNYLSSDDKRRIALYELGIDSLKIEALKDTIDKKAFLGIRKSKDIATLEAYINKHSDSDYQQKVIDKRNKLLFKKVKKENTASAYLEFYRAYPNSKEAIEAKNRYEKQLFVEQTADGRAIDYQNFIYKYLDSPYLRAAQDSLFSVMTKDGKIQSYYNFVKGNPFNPHLEKAWRKIYTLYMTDYSPEKIVEFRIDYPDYPFIEELKMDIQLAVKRFIPYQQEGKWGFIDVEGHVMIHPIYQSVEPFSDGLALVVQDGSVGYIDKAGNMVIPLTYEDAESFQNGYAIVSKNDLYGIVDRTNKVVVPIIYEDVGAFNDGLALVANEDFYGYCNTKGEVTIPVELDYASDFKNGYAIVERDGKKGIINALGGLVTSIQYNWIELFNDHGLCRAKKDSTYGMLDENGAEVLPFEYTRIGEMKNDRALVIRNGHYGYVNSRGAVIIELDFVLTEGAMIWGEFIQDYVKFNKKDKFGIIDTAGAEIFPAIFQDVGLYAPSGYTAVKKRGKWGYSDENLKLVIPYNYEYANTFINDQAIVKKDSLCGLIDKKGDWLIQPEYNHIKRMEGIGYVVQQGRYKGVIGLNLESEVELKYDEIVPIEDTKLLKLKRDQNTFFYDYQHKKLLSIKPLKS